MEAPIELFTLLAVFVGLLGLWHFSRPLEVARAAMKDDGVQEATIVVRGRYLPAVVVATRGVPLRLRFERQEEQACSERVIFSGFQQEHWLAPYTTTVVQFIPNRTGEFLFTCGMGMYQGRLVVEEPRPTGGLARFLRAPVSGLRSSRRR